MYVYRLLEWIERFEVNVDVESVLFWWIDCIEDDYKEKRDYDKKIMVKCNIKFVMFDGIYLWLDYKFYFDVCVFFNNWNYKEKGLYLVVLLRGVV